MSPGDLSDDLPAGVPEGLLQALPDAVVVSDADGRIRFWNPAAERVFGFAAAEALGASLDLIIPERLRARHWAGYAEVMASGHSRYGAGDLLSVPALRKDGERISVQFSVALLRDADGRPCGVAAVMRDVTAEFEKRRALERELAELRAELREAGDGPRAALGCPGHWQRRFGPPDGSRAPGPAWLPKAE